MKSAIDTMPDYTGNPAPRLSTESLNWINLICFKLSWVGLVVYQNQALLFVLPLLLVSLSSLLKKKFYWKTWLVAFVLGVAVDQALAGAGVFQFNELFLPAWLVMLWTMFALTLPHGFGFMGRLPLSIQAVIGAFAGMGSYAAGMQLGAVIFPQGFIMTMLILALVWAVLLPMFYLLHKRLHA